MLFLNTALLLGALGILVPILIHLLNRRSNRVVEWGAMGFLLDSLALRNRRIQLEEALLMAARCLLVGLLAVALARPFVPPGSSVPWLVILPLLLLGVVGLGVATVLHEEPRWRRRIAGLSVVLLLACAALLIFERHLNLSRFAPAARQDIAVIIDASTSMTLRSGGETNFERAVAEARDLVRRAPRGHAFSLILAGPAPGAIVLDPTTDRAAILGALEEIAPVDGAMAAYDALMLASLSLARGDSPAKQIVFFTDEQNLGWEIGRNERWNFLREAFRNLPAEPQVMLRKLPLPPQIRNLAVVDISLSREILGIDRPVDVVVTVENTGDEAVTPGALVLHVDGGRQHSETGLGQILPGERRSVVFPHHFREPGAHALVAELEVEDDIAMDDRAHRAVHVAEGLRVLIVDGRPSARALDRASAFAAVALAPSSLTLDPSLEPNRPGVADEASDDFDMYYDPTLDLVPFLVEPTVVEAPAIGAVEDFERYDVVVLADVPRLPGGAAAAISEFVEEGGGLLVTAGGRADPAFYNAWRRRGEGPLLPAQLEESLAVAAAADPFHPSASSLTHPALAKVADPTRSDLSSASFPSYRPQRIPESLVAESAVGARLNDGGILLSSREVGAGRVLLLGVPLDLSGGNLVSRQAFIPMIHELVYHLADPSTQSLDLEPSWEIALALGGARGKRFGQGLRGRYYASHEATEPSLVRIDERIDFRWGPNEPAPGLPTDHFRIEWEGSLAVPETGRYHFSMEVDDAFELWIDGRRIGELTRPGGRQRLSVDLEEGRWHAFRGLFREDTGEARAVLSWESEGRPREVVPSRWFRSFVPDSGGQSGGATELARYEVEGPDGRLRLGLLSSTAGGRTAALSLRGEISSGLYRLRVPPDEEVFFSRLLRRGSLELPFTVKRDPAESRLVRLSESDEQFMAGFVTLAQPQTLDELVGFLRGTQFGEELWRYLALGAFLFLLAEIALARWIARSRRLGEEISIRFEAKDAPSAAFREQLARMGKG